MQSVPPSAPYSGDFSTPGPLIAAVPLSRTVRQAKVPRLETQPVAINDPRVQLSVPRTMASYFILEQSTNLPNFFPVSAVLFGGENLWRVPDITKLDETSFWRVGEVPIVDPLDLDADGIDDYYELAHGLNPLDQSDATTSSGHSDFNGRPLNWLELYRFHFQQNFELYNAVGRELSTFNFGQPTANHEGVSREVSLFNTPQPDVDQDGIEDGFEIVHGLNPHDPLDALRASGFTEDFPNDTGKPLNWLEVYRFHFAKNTVLYNSTSREVSVFNFGQPTAPYEAISREASVFNWGQPVANYEAISREVSVFNQP